ncbi:kinase-like protein [Sanghuangporus baumii]|uniref:Kinase-like protein n=1 Tax=Sanghuangporus baumii TaxID=108892 RepID=A0A9Q5N5M7_SANBA|nr:kinase-like protein [Sanghuangporus baumii]
MWTLGGRDDFIPRSEHYIIMGYDKSITPQILQRSALDIATFQTLAFTITAVDIVELLMTPPTLGPELSSPSPMSTPTANLSAVSLNRPSSASLRGRSTDSARSTYPTISRTSSNASIPFGSDEEVEEVREAGLRHAKGRLNAKTLEFARDSLEIILALKVPTWSSSHTLSAEGVKVFKVSGSLTNAVFFISYPSSPSLRTILLRIYGSSSSQLISRPHELHTLHVLSSRYRIGPRVYGTFENGRVEEYFESAALTAAEMRDPIISGWIGARMAELHCVDIALIEEVMLEIQGENAGWEVLARKNVRKWLPSAREVLRLPTVSDEFKSALDLDRFVEDWERYMTWLSNWEKINGASKRVFAHNDTQYGNLLMRKNIKEGTPGHRQIIVVDFEYAGPNSAAFDIANHFHEWTADYHSSTPHILVPERYPTEQERQNFYKAYLIHSTPPFMIASATSDGRFQGEFRGSFASKGEIPLDLAMESEKLERQVGAWSPASHAMWAVWGLVQAREDLELATQAQSKGIEPDSPEFDYLGYARCRTERFRAEINALGI